MPTNYFISGIGTDVGKTVASAVLQLHLEADYWKPIQSGDLDFGDRDRVQRLTGLPDERYHPERFRLRTPASPHLAARLDEETISLGDFALPRTQRNLLVEGAGGLLVPLNDRDCIIDLIDRLGLATILVSRHYLGSINHTLASIEALRRRNLPLAGLVYIGDNDETEAIIRKHAGVDTIARLPEWDPLEPTTLRTFATDTSQFAPLRF